MSTAPCIVGIFGSAAPERAAMTRRNAGPPASRASRAARCRIAPRAATPVNCVLASTARMSARRSRVCLSGLRS